MTIREKLSQLAIAGLVTTALAGSAHAIDVSVDAGIGSVSAGADASVSTSGSAGADASVSTGTVDATTTNSIGDSVDSDTQISTDPLSNFMAEITAGLNIDDSQNTANISINGDDADTGSSAATGTNAAAFETAFQSLSTSNQQKILDECEKILANPSQSSEAKQALCSLIQ